MRKSLGKATICGHSKWQFSRVVRRSLRRLVRWNKKAPKIQFCCKHIPIQPSFAPHTSMCSHRESVSQVNCSPIVFAHFRKQRFYLYTRRLPSDLQDIDRDVFNEKPSKEDIIAVPEGQGDSHLIFCLENCSLIFRSFARHTKAVQFRNTAHFSRRHSSETVRHRVSENG